MWEPSYDRIPLESLTLKIVCSKLLAVCQLQLRFSNLLHWLPLSGPESVLQEVLTPDICLSLSKLGGTGLPGSSPLSWTQEASWTVQSVQLFTCHDGQS